MGIDPSQGQPARALAFSYARREPGALRALFALDATLARIALGTRDALVTQMRLTWWHDALIADEVRASPILRALADKIDRRTLAGLVDAWMRLLGDMQADDLRAFAVERSALFDRAAQMIGVGDDTIAAGEGWALADLATTTANPALAERAAAMARPLLAAAAGQWWSADGRALGGLVHLAQIDLRCGRNQAGVQRVARLAWHRLTGK